MVPGCFLWCPEAGPKAIALTETQDVPSEHQGTIFHCEDDQKVVRSLSMETFQTQWNMVLDNQLQVTLFVLGC